MYSRIHRSHARREATGCSSKGLVKDVWEDSSGWRAGLRLSNINSSHRYEGHGILILKLPGACIVCERDVQMKGEVSSS
jgi:hypothetical protein